MQAVLADKGVRWVAGGWLAFMTENIVLSHNRQEIIQQVGEKAYRTGYSSLSLAACSSIAYGYLKHGRRQGPIVWRPGPAAGVAAVILQTCGLVGFSQMFPAITSTLSADKTVKEPSCAVEGEKVAVKEKEIRGLKRVTRHPSLWSLGLVGVGTALTTPFAPEIVFFSMPCIFAFIGGAHQDYRHRRGWGGNLTQEVDATTSHVPFVALLQGKQSWEQTWRELKQDNVAAAAVLGAVLAALRVARR